MQEIIRKIDTLTEFIGKLTAVVLILLSVLIIYDALARYLFSTGSLMLQELEWHLFDLIILFSVSYTLKHDKHVRVDLFYMKMSEKNQKRVNKLGLILMVMPFSLLMIYVGLSFVEMSFFQMDGSANAGGLPLRFIVKGLISLGFIFLLLQAISQLLSLKESSS